MALGIDSLKANISGVFFANLFEAQITLPQLLNEYSNDAKGILSLTIEEVNMPGRALTTVDAGGDYYPSYALPFGYKNNEITLTFMLTDDYKARNLIELWLDLIVDQSTYLVRYPDVYLGGLNIRQLNAQQETIHEVLCEGAYPKGMEDITFTASSTDYVKLQVPFVYKRLITLQNVGRRRRDRLKTFQGGETV